MESRYTVINEMLSSIIHQWREPLGAVGAIQSGITARVMFGQAIENDFLLESAQTSTNILRHLSETIDTYYGFIKTNSKQESAFSVKSAMDTIQKIMSYSLEKSGVTLRCTMDGDYTLQGCENEFSQVIINIISNDRDIFAIRTAMEPRSIEIDIDSLENSCIIRIKDNAGGIKLAPIEKIFEPSVSSKGGSGIGLYIAKNIIEYKFNGTISAENNEHGAIFTITVPFIDKNRQIANESGHHTNGKTKMVSRIVELENAEKDMRKWADIFSKAHWGIAVSRGKSNYIEIANPAFAAMHGYSMEELYDIPSTDFFSPDYLYEFAQKVEEAYEEGFVSFDTVRLRKDGAEFAAHIDLTAVKDADGEALYRIANIKDITEEKRQKSMLDIISYAINHIADAVYLADKEARFQWVNDVACNSLGYTQNELTQMCVCDINTKWTIENWPHYLNTIQAVGKVTLIGEHLRKDGSTFPVEISANYFEYEGIGYSLVIAKDITERRAIDRTLQRSITSLGHFASAILGVLYICSIDANNNYSIPYVSEKLYEIIGIRHDELDKSRVVAKLIASNCVPTQESMGFTIIHPQKGERRIKGYSLPQSQDDGSTLWYGVLFDVTEENKIKTSVLTQS